MVRRRTSMKGRFKPGCVPHNKGVNLKNLSPEVEFQPPTYVRLNRDVQEMVDSRVTVSTSIDAASPNTGSARMLLRPLPARPTMLQNAQQATVKCPEEHSYRLLHAGKTAELWNIAIYGHKMSSPDCNGQLGWHKQGEIQRGLCWREQLSCDSCDYVSERRNLYTEVQTTRRGPKPASANYGLQVGMAHTGTSNTGFCKMILATNTPAPSKSSMQSASNKVGKILVKTNESDMKNIRQDLRDIQVARGHDEDSPINVEMDSRYSNPIYSGGGNTPFQPATQMTQVVTENSTSKKKVIAVTNKSKLCQICALLNSKSTVISGKGTDSHDCTASLQQDESIGNERQWARESLTQLNNDNITCNIVTTDPDSSAFKAAEDLFLSGETKSPPTHQLDTRHVTSNQRKRTKDIKFSKTMFGCSTQAQRMYRQGRFSKDLGSRCQAEHDAAMIQYAGDTGKVSKHIAHVRNTIVTCYCGDHKACRRYSLVCRGRKTNNWVHKSKFLNKSIKSSGLKPTKCDKEKLIEAIEYRLGPLMLKNTKHLLTTQKTEAVNRAISATAPRNMTFSRNYTARVHAAVHAVNAGIGEALISECDAVGAPITHGTRITRRLLKMQENDIKQKSRKKSKKSKLRRHLKCKKLYELHENKEKSSDDYQKDVCMPKTLMEHSYCKPRKTRKKN